MLTIKECRDKLGDLSIQMTDKQVEQIRNSLYVMVENIIDQEIIQAKVIPNPQVQLLSDSNQQA